MRRLAVSALCLALLLAALAGSNDATASPAPAAPSANAVRTVTLPTGDRVAVTQTATGTPSVTLAPGSDGPSRSFQVLASGTHLYVVPQVDTAVTGSLNYELGIYDLGTGDAIRVTLVAGPTSTPPSTRRDRASRSRRSAARTSWARRPTTMRCRAC